MTKNDRTPQWYGTAVDGLACDVVSVSHIGRLKTSLPNEHLIHLLHTLNLTTKPPNCCSEMRRPCSNRIRHLCAGWQLLLAMSVQLASCFSLRPPTINLSALKKWRCHDVSRFTNPCTNERTLVALNNRDSDALRCSRGGSLQKKSIFRVRETLPQLSVAYLDLLDREPFMTKSITAAIVSGIGDILSQWIEAHVAGTGFVLNWVRLGAFFLCGGLYVGPFVHAWYQQLWKIGRWMERRHGSSKNLQTLAQVVVDQTVGVALFFPSYFYVYEYLEAAVALRAPVLATAHAKCREQIASVLIMQYYIWPFTNWVNFAYVPENLRVLFSNVIAVFWNAYLCARVA